jgi:hypothetical protein
MPGEPRLKQWDCNEPLGTEMALKTHKSRPFNKGLEEPVRAANKPELAAIFGIFA